MKNKLTTAIFTTLMLFSFWANAQTTPDSSQIKLRNLVIEQNRQQAIAEKVKILKETDYIFEGILTYDYVRFSDSTILLGIPLLKQRIKITKVIKGNLKIGDIEIISRGGGAMNQYSMFFCKKNIFNVTKKYNTINKKLIFQTAWVDLGENPDIQGFKYKILNSSYLDRIYVKDLIFDKDELLNFISKYTKINWKQQKIDNTVNKAKINLLTEDTTGLQKRIQKQVEEGEKKIQEMLELRRKHLVKPIKDSVKVAPKRLNFRDASPMNVTPLSSTNFGIKISIQNQKYTINGTTSFVEADLMVEASAANTFMDLNWISITYNPAVFGNNVVSANKLQVAFNPDLVAPSNTRYDVLVFDRTSFPNTFLVNMQSPLWGMGTSPYTRKLLPLAPYRVVTIKLSFDSAAACGQVSGLNIKRANETRNNTTRQVNATLVTMAGLNYDSYTIDTLTKPFNLCTGTIDDFNPKTMRAGLGEMLTIKGKNFGATRNGNHFISKKTYQIINISFFNFTKILNQKFL